MKNTYYFFIFYLLISCNSEDATDCLQTAGKTIEKEVEVSVFTKITVHKKIAMVIAEGPVQKVLVKTGKNLLNDINFKVIDNELIIRNNNECNLIRDYNNTTVYITAPNITVIRNASEFTIKSEGVLTYPNLYLRSSGEKDNFLAVGDWFLTINNENVRVWSNGIATFYINGTTNKLDLSFSDGDTRFKGKDFRAKNVTVRQVSQNDLEVFPTESLTGSIHSVGNVISYNKPPLVNVDVQSVGLLIFK